MSYQAVVRDANNDLVTDTQIGMQISILQGAADGTAVYVETQTPTTNANGLVSIEIGGGTVVSGDFTAIDWSAGPYFIKTETDPAGGTSYTITGTSQLLSVPYALYAKKANSFTGNIKDTVTAVLDTTTQFVKEEVDGDITNEIQHLSLKNDTLSLTNDTAKINLSELTIKKDWCFVLLKTQEGTNQEESFSAGDYIKFYNPQGNLPTNNYNLITLHANKTYELSSMILFRELNDNIEITFSWYDLTNNERIGSLGYINSSNTKEGNTGAYYIFTPTTDVQVELRIIYVSGNNRTMIIQGFSYASVKEL